jgi:assimilatory nitrate reductase catalytic subunit
MSIEGASMNAPANPPPVRTTCPYCGVGCGVLARPDGFGGAQISGDPDHPSNFGRLCSKGSALGETLSLDGRLLHPVALTGTGGYRRVSWDDALDRVASGFRRAIDEHGPDSVAFYVSGQMLTEDYYVANKLMKGFIGSGNIDTNSRLCMASSVAGHRRAFGADTVPGCYEDLDEADLLVLVGSNAAWCHPILYQRMMRNKAERGARVVVIDPRRTPTADDTDLALPLAPGSDTALFSGLLAHLARRSLLDTTFIGSHTSGFDEALARAREIAPDVEAVARACDLDPAAVATFFDWFATTEKVVTLYSQGVNQSAQGTDKVNAILNCHLATGRIGRPGMGPFSLTGQPNAMGGREVGGLANQLAAHMAFEPESVDRVRRFWNAPAVAPRAGLKAVELFDAVADGRIRALWVMGTNPVVSMPRADAVRAALGSLDLFVVTDVVRSNDTINAGAHLVLPAAAWGEKDGTVTNSERRISRQRPFLAPPGEAKPDWWIVSEVGRRLGFADAFDYRSAADVFAEHARLSEFENEGARDFNLAGLTGFDQDDYDALQPLQWPVAKGQATGAARLFGDGAFFTPDRRARFIAVEAPRLAAETAKPWPLLLNTGRVRDHWHTMTRTGKSPRLGTHIVEPYVDVAPDDARRFGLTDGRLARVSSASGSAILRVRVTDAQRCGEIFAPIHWTAETSSNGRIGGLVQSDNDPHSGQPELKATPAAIAPVTFAVEGFLLSRSRPELPPGFWWAATAVESGCGIRFATNESFSTLVACGQKLLGEGSLVTFEDPARQIYRAALVRDNRLEACLFLSGVGGEVPSWDWLKLQLAAPSLSPAARRSLVAGRSPDGPVSEGPIVCVCFAVGLGAIQDILKRGTATTVEEIGKHLKAGTNCGSCIPELKRIVSARTRELA